MGSSASTSTSDYHALAPNSPSSVYPSLNSSTSSPRTTSPKAKEPVKAKEIRKSEESTDYITRPMEKESSMESFEEKQNKRLKLIDQCEARVRAAIGSKYSSEKFAHKWIGFYVEWLNDSTKEPILCSSHLELSNQCNGNYFGGQVSKIIKNEPILIRCTHTIVDRKTVFFKEMEQLYRTKAVDLRTVLPWTLPFKPRMITLNGQFSYWIEWYYRDYYVTIEWSFLSKTLTIAKPEKDIDIDNYRLWSMDNTITVSFQHRNNTTVPSRSVPVSEKFYGLKPFNIISKCMDGHTESVLAWRGETCKQLLVEYGLKEDTWKSQGNHTTKPEHLSSEYIHPISHYAKRFAEVVETLETHIRWQVDYKG